MTDEEEEDDELLMAAAGQWAASAADSPGEDDDSSPKKKKKKSKKSKKSKKEKKEKKSKRDKPKEESDTHATPANSIEEQTAPVIKELNTTRQVFSLHLTTVPYEATQTDIRCAFVEKGCYVTSVRLVYDRTASGERKFRGVAFVDLADEASFQKGLELHGTKFLGNKHKINVRPTKSKGELTEIVRKTQEKVALLIARSKEKAKEERESNPEAYEAKMEANNNKQEKKKRKRGGNSDSNDGEAHTKKSKVEKEGEKSKNTVVSNKSTNKKEGEAKKKQIKSKRKNTDVKLTKKQRAKKAAVINMFKRKKMK